MFILQQHIVKIILKEFGRLKLKGQMQHFRALTFYETPI